MVAIIISISVMLSILISAFVAFSPHLHSIVEKDFMRRAYNNAIHYSLKVGQLKMRADTMAASPSMNPPYTEEIELPLRAGGNTPDNLIPQRKIVSKLIITEDNQIEVKVTMEHIK